LDAVLDAADSIAEGNGSSVASVIGTGGSGAAAGAGVAAETADIAATPNGKKQDPPSTAKKTKKKKESEQGAGSCAKKAKTSDVVVASAAESAAGHGALVTGSVDKQEKKKKPEKKEKTAKDTAKAKKVDKEKDSHKKDKKVQPSEPKDAKGSAHSHAKAAEKHPVAASMEPHVSPDAGPGMKIAAGAVGAAAARVADVQAEPLGMLGPIVGVMDAPRLALQEAAVATGVEHMDACGFMARESGSVLAVGDKSGLDADEAGALNLYTMESGLYPALNAHLRDCNRLKLKPFFPLLKLLLIARQKLPKFVGTVWRGVKADLRAMYPKGKELYWWAFSSTTKELSTLTNPMFLGKDGVRTIFNIQIRSGVDIMRYSVYQGTESEAEVLLFPGTKLKVVDAMDMGHGLYQVHLQEVDLPVQLLK